MAAITIPASFSLTRYRLVLEAVEPLILSRMKAKTLRGAFGYALKRTACLNYAVCKSAKFCLIGNDCPYGYIFESAPGAGAEGLRNIEHVPPPYIFEVGDDSSSTVQPGETLAFDLILIGQANAHQPIVEEAFRALGAERGLGKTNGKYTLLTMEPLQTVDPAQLAVRTAALPGDRIALHFLTPTKLKHNKRWVTSGPPFQALIKVLLGRVSSLCRFHGGAPLEVDFRELIDRAAHVKISEAYTRWESQSRFSTRQNRGVALGGLTGQITYAGDIEEYLPLLALGELVHVGKGTVFGNGQYVIN